MLPETNIASNKLISTTPWDLENELILPLVLRTGAYGLEVACATSGRFHHILAAPHEQSIGVAVFDRWMMALSVEQQWKQELFQKDIAPTIKLWRPWIENQTAHQSQLAVFPA